MVILEHPVVVASARTEPEKEALSAKLSNDLKEVMFQHKTPEASSGSKVEADKLDTVASIDAEDVETSVKKVGYCPMSSPHPKVDEVSFNELPLSSGGESETRDSSPQIDDDDSLSMSTEQKIQQWCRPVDVLLPKYSRKMVEKYMASIKKIDPHIAHKSFTKAIDEVKREKEGIITVF